MTNHLNDISNHLRDQYFKNHYMSFSIQSGYYILRLQTTGPTEAYEIPVIDYSQYQELQDYVTKTLFEKFPELIL